MEQNIKQTNQKNDEISIVELIDIIKKYWKFLLSKWLIILVFGLSGGAIGLAASFIVKPKFTAHLSFALVEKASGSGGLADLASSFGFGGLIGGNQNAFSGDNLLEIMRSRRTIEQTLLTPVSYNGKIENLAEIYIDVNKLRNTWLKNNKNKDLRELKYPVGQDRRTFNRTQDSVLFTLYETILKSNSLSIQRKDKKLSFVSVDFTSKGEQLSKLFAETLIAQTYNFYRETKTSQSIKNIEMMQQKADSVKALYESAMYKGASFSAVNINAALQKAAVPRLKQESDARLYGTVYTEILKNLETLKLDLARETPIVQIIDKPILPLKKDRLGKIKGVVFGGAYSGFLIVIALIINFYVREKKII